MLGEKLKELREKHHLTQAQMSKLLDIKQNVYSGYETNKHKPNIDILIKIADTFSVSTDYLLDRYK